MKTKNEVAAAFEVASIRGDAGAAQRCLILGMAFKELALEVYDLLPTNDSRVGLALEHLLSAKTYTLDVLITKEKPHVPKNKKKAQASD